MLLRAAFITVFIVVLSFGQTTEAKPPPGQTPQPRITDVFVDFPNTQFIITGENFGTDPVVTLFQNGLPSGNQPSLQLLVYLLTPRLCQ